MDDFDVYQARIRAHQREHTETLQASAAAIASHLPGWSYHRPTDPDLARLNAYLDGPDGMRIILHWSGAPRPATVRGELPATRRGGSPYLPAAELERCSICFNPRRPARHLAGEITRRLLPAYREVLEAARRAAEAEDAYLDSAEQLLAELAQAAGLDRPSAGQLQARRLALPAGTVETFGAGCGEPASARLTLRLAGPLAVEVLQVLSRRLGTGSSRKGAATRSTPCP